MSRVLEIAPQWEEPTLPFCHTWEGLVNVDQFRWIVRRDLQEHLRMARTELGARHVRAVGIFDDELRVLGRAPQDFAKGLTDWRPRLNWQIVDYCIDSLIDLGMDPMFTTTFMPSALASGSKTVFSTQANVTLPKDWQAWSDLVSQTLGHFVRRYGKARVASWYHEVWNEPNLREAFFAGSKDDFFYLWEVTYHAIKSVDADFRVGGPSTAGAEWIDDLIRYGRERGCEPDYIVGHIYNQDSEHGPLSPFAGAQTDQVSRSPHFADGVIRGTRELLDSLNFRGELQWNEWGRFWHAWMPQRESANEAAFAVKSMAAISQFVDQLAPWCLSDIYDQIGYGAEAFHGNYGLLNLQGLRKPAYQAWRLLGRLGTRRYRLSEDPSLFRCEGAIVTPTANGVSALVYRFAPDDGTLATTQEVKLHLPADLPIAGMRLFKIDGRQNNVLHQWRELGSPAILSREDSAELRARNDLALAPDLIRRQGNTLIFSMEPASVALLELRQSVF